MSKYLDQIVGCANKVRVFASLLHKGADLPKQESEMRDDKR